MERKTKKIKNVAILTVFASLFVGLVACKSVQKSPKTWTYIESTSQVFIPGIGGGRGVNYGIRIKNRGTTQVVMDSLWLKTKEGVRRVPVSYRKMEGDTSVYSATYLVRSKEPGNPDGPMDTGEEVVGPVKFESDAYFRYMEGGKKKYFHITEFRKLEKVIYP